VNPSAPAAPLRVEDFPDVLPLRDAAGRRVGLFSDRGSWLAVAQAEDGGLELVDTEHGRDFGRLELGGEVAQVTVWSDRLDVELAGGRAVRIGFAAPGTLLVEGAPELAAPLPTRPFSEGILVGRTLDPPPPPAVFARNRERRRRAFERFSALAGRPLDERERRLAVRALTTLAWNTRAPRGDLLEEGVVPSPFAYRGYWGWDSWKHAHALGRVAPELSAAQMRVMFARQRADGMVPDTAYPDRRQDNWSNTKPDLSGWALESVVAGTAETYGGRRADVVRRELLGHCEAFQRWWDRDRRLPGEVLHRPGGVDHRTATWDHGWDDSARFAGAALVPHAGWMLLDVVPPDLNAWHLVTQRTLARLALVDAPGGEAEWRRRAEEQAAALQGTWDAQQWAFVDRRGDGVRGLLSIATAFPVWAGAATEGQAEAVRAALRDPERFATPMPFPTLAVSEPAFDPQGYWDGSVWVDHAAVALHVLGAGDDADRAAAAELGGRLLAALDRSPTLWECYDPTSGGPVRSGRAAAPQFSWTAAAVLWLLAGGPHPGPLR